MTVQNHYDSHLARFYEWMVGDFDTKQKEQQEYFVRNDIKPLQNGIAIDLGAGHGLQSVSLANLGFKVKAIDFNDHLLESLRFRGTKLGIKVVHQSLLAEENFSEQAEVIVCMGDTIAHLDSFDQIRLFFASCRDGLLQNGKLILSYRDYGIELTENQRFIPVKADEDKILTCFLEYFGDRVRVTDLLHEQINGQWVQKASSYFKIRISNSIIEQMIKEVGLEILKTENMQRMNYLVAQKSTSI